MSNRILIIEDERAIVDILQFNLEKEGYQTSEALDGLEGLDKALGEDYDLILLDVMLPGLDGFEICRQVRAQKQTPILMLTAREEEIDKVLGLELGADDYITKPFSMRELMARIKANLRRQQGVQTEGGEDVDGTTRINDLVIDLNRYEVVRAGKPVELTLREFELLRYLAAHPDRVFSREELLGQVWGYEYYGDVRTVDVTVRRLREKLESVCADPAPIMTKRGVGYYFAKR